MLRKVENVSFKALFYPPKTKFTDSQNRTIEDIKKKLSEKLKKESYLIATAPNSTDSVELYKLNGYGEDKAPSYNNYDSKELIGVYNEKNPFVKSRKISQGLLTLGLISLGAMAVVVISSLKPPSNKIKPTIEKNIATVKDSVVNLKNTLELVVK